MSRIEKLAIRGIRSFDPQEEVKIEFFRPLTLIQGHNGSGKTTIIECLKMASCGSLPPLATNGKTFICDPKINNNSETKASIKLKFLTPRDKEVLVIRNFQLCLKNNKYEFKRLEQLLKSYNSSGELVTINSTCIDIDKQVPLLMHSSRAILENVIFCHQEETNWPFTEAGNLKKVFDEIFDTAKYTKALEDLKEINKTYTAKSKELKIKIELIAKDYEQFKKINVNIEITQDKIKEYENVVTELIDSIGKADKDYKQIGEYEDQFRQKEHDLNMAKMRMEEKHKQILGITSDPLFNDYTDNETEFANYIQEYNIVNHGQISINDLSNQSNNLNRQFSILNNIKINIEKLQNDSNSLSDSINRIDANVMNLKDTYFTLGETKKGINSTLINELGMENINENSDYSEIKIAIESAETKIREKISALDEKKRSFEGKVSDKLRDYEIQQGTIEKMKKDLVLVYNKKEELKRNVDQFNSNMNSLENINKLIENFARNIQKLENEEIVETESKINSEEINKNDLDNLINNTKSEILNLIINTNSQNPITNFDFNKFFSFGSDKIKRDFTSLINSVTKSSNLITNAVTKINEFNYTFKTNLNTSNNRHSIIKSLEELLILIKQKREEITEEKQTIREHNLKINTQIEMLEKSLYKTNEEMKTNHKLQKQLFDELKFLFEKLDIPIIESQNEYKTIQDNLEKLLIVKMELETRIANLGIEKTAKVLESKFIEEYLTTLHSEGVCSFCNKNATKKETGEINKTLNEKMAELQTMTSKCKSTYDEKVNLLSEINKMDNVMNKVKSLIEENNKNMIRFNDNQNELNAFLKERKIIENSSKEKSSIIIKLENFLNGTIHNYLNNNSFSFNSSNSINEELFTMKTEIINEINKISSILNNYGIFNLDPFEFEILSIFSENIINKLTSLADLENKIKNVDSNLINLKQTKSSLFEQVNKLYAESKNLENKRQKIVQFSDVSSIQNKILEIDREIMAKESDLETLQLQQDKLSEVKSLLVNKREEFETMYKGKLEGYNKVIQELSLVKIKTDLAIREVEKWINSNNSGNNYVNNYGNISGNNYVNNFNNLTILNKNYDIDSAFNKLIEFFKSEKTNLENRRSVILKEINRLNEECASQENENKKNQIREKNYKNNILLHNLKEEIKTLNEYLMKNQAKVTINSKISEAKEKIREKLNLLNSQYNLNLGKMHELNNNLNKLHSELKNDNYFEIDSRYNKLKVDYILAIETGKQVESYYEALDQSLLKYHAKRMEEINKLINYYWNMTYKNQDIKWIEIRSDPEKTGRSRSYNYRIVFGTSDDQELDMRGRCSAGQKVLASIVIRLALAETFCNNCGILCLDEPTTNLDEQHSKSLARALRELIQSRSDDQNFQLIVITHDPQFVDMIGSDFCDSFWSVSRNEKKFSQVELKPINCIFGGP